MNILLDTKQVAQEFLIYSKIIGHNLQTIQGTEQICSTPMFFKGKECNEAIIFVLRSQQLSQVQGGRHFGQNWHFETLEPIFGLF